MDCIYAAGGWVLSEAVEGTPASWHSSGQLTRFDRRTRAWSLLDAMPTPVADTRAVALGGRVYVPGGRAGSSIEEGRLACLQCYDVVAGRWDTGCAPMAAARCNAGVAAAVGSGGGGEVWAVGGYGDLDLGEDGVFLSSVERYSPGSNSWSPGFPLPVACGSGCCVVVEH